MSQNVKIIHAIFERWNAGDRSVPTEYLDPAVELESALSSVTGEPYRGHAGFEKWMSDLEQQFAEWQVRVDEVRDVGDLVIAIGGIHLRGRTQRSRARPTRRVGRTLRNRSPADASAHLFGPGRGPKGSGPVGLGDVRERYWQAGKVTRLVADAARNLALAELGVTE